jgi:hypothetical protein
VRAIAGIVGAERKGLGVDGGCAVLRRFEYIERRLLRLLAGWLPPLPVWEVKQMLGRHLWEDGEPPPQAHRRDARRGSLL